MQINIKTLAGKATKFKDAKADTALIYFFSESEIKNKKLSKLAEISTALHDRVLELLKDKSDFLPAGTFKKLETENHKGPSVWLVSVSDDSDMYRLLELCRGVCTSAIQNETKTLILGVSDSKREEQVLNAMGASACTRVFLMPVFGKKQKDQKPFILHHVSIVGSTSQKKVRCFEEGWILSNGTNIARRLATLPPNFLDPEIYGEEIRKLAKENGLKVKFHSNKELKKMGAGAFTAVDQGNPDSVGGIYEISYAPSKGSKKAAPIVVVGKGLCFDTGGYDVKISSGMVTMKGDMQGSSVALGCVVAAAQLKYPKPVTAFLAITENHLSPKAYTADEVITALNGVTIEVINTDAEGRMVLADTLTLASRSKPKVVVDFATLTGSAVRSLGTKFSAGFTNQKNWHASIVQGGEESGERVWTFPLDKSYFKPLESKVADTLQCLKGPGPDHIYAAAFLSKFVEAGVPWVHIDMSASENDGGLGHVPSMFTGFGVRWFFSFLEIL